VIIDVEDPLARILIDRAEVNLEWDAARQAILMPLQLVSGGNRFTVLAQAEAPAAGSRVWGLKVSGGSVVLASAAAGDSVVLIRLMLRLRIDPGSRKINIEQGEFGNADLGVALSGGVDFSGENAQLAIALAGTRMSVATLKKLWPV